VLELLMSEHILFIFEGRITEQNITDNLCLFFINDEGKRLARASYGFNIYQLYQKLSDDPGLDLYELVVEEILKRDLITDNDQAVIEIGDSEKISDIYLFFDYDCHCTNADDQKLQVMLTRFDDSQGDGLLNISYPMVEAIRHQENAEYTYMLHSTADLSNYKDWIKAQRRAENISTDYFNWGLYTGPIWKEIIDVNLRRANQLVNNTSILPDIPVESLEIFDAQKSKHIPSSEVVVLSSFPLMLHIFYGNKLSEKVNLV
jgi:hypothetical protein